MRQTLLINDGWKFKLGKIKTNEIQGHFATYMHSKAKNGRGPEAASYYDADFKTVHLPHDYVIEGELDPQYNEANGSLKREEAWYRRYFDLPCKVDGKRFVLLFDGAGKKTTVWCNGHYAGENNSMYNSFHMDITPYLLEGEVNTLAVHIENDDLEGWWYEGAGIYRNVYLVITDEIAVDTYGTFINPTYKGNKEWESSVETTIHSEVTAKIIVRQSILDQDGEVVSKTAGAYEVAYGKTTLEQSLTTINPELWNLETSYLYTLKTEIIREMTVIDTYTTRFGFRTLRFDGQKGFYLNEQPVKMRGVCLHQDHGNLGVAVPEGISRYRLEKLKTIGVNALRSAHNNPSTTLLDLCDELGILVMDENRWFNFSDRTQKELVSMLKRDRNHPSVVVWSIGNEEPLQNTITGKRLVESLSKIVKAYDTTRPVTLALNGGFYDSYAAKASDVVGVNYNLQGYDKFPLAHPNKAIIATESAASRNNRGMFFSTDSDKFSGTYATAYDTKTSSFGSSQIEAIEASETHDFVCGTFIWTGIEYRGEAAWPKLASASGLFDMAMFEKDTAYMAKALWTEAPMMHIMPHWSLPEDKIGTTLDVVTYTNADEVELIVNGESFGRQTVEKFKTMHWDVVYQPGWIKAIGYRNNEVICEEHLTTVEKPQHFVIENVASQVTNTGEDVVIFKMWFEDEAGHWVPYSNQRIGVEVLDSTQAEILCVENADALDHETPKAHNKKMLNGLVQAVVRIKEGAKQVGIKVKVEGLNDEQIKVIEVEQVAPIPRLKSSNKNLSIETLRLWQTCDGFEDLEKELRFDDMNSSEPISLENYVPKQEGYLLFSAKTVVPECLEEMSLVFKKMRGDVAIKIFHETNCWPHPTPQVFRTIVEKYTLEEATDIRIPLKGFSANEQVKLVMVASDERIFGLNEIYYTVE